MKKYLTSHITTKQTSHNPIFKNRKKNVDFKNDDRGQLFIIGGVMITLAILSLAVISTNLPDVAIPHDETSYLKPEYDNIRQEFGIALQNTLGSKLKYVPTNDDDDILHTYFNQIKNVFV